MDLKIMAAVSLGMAICLMFTKIVDAIENHYRMKLMMLGAIENAHKMQDK